MTPATFILALIGVYIFLIAVMCLGIYLECKRKVKDIDHAHKIQQTTISEPDDIRWEELGIFSEQHPLHEYRAGCN